MRLAGITEARSLLQDFIQFGTFVCTCHLPFKTTVAVREGRLYAGRRLHYHFSHFQVSKSEKERCKNCLVAFLLFRTTSLVNRGLI